MLLLLAIATICVGAMGCTDANSEVVALQEEVSKLQAQLNEKQSDGPTVVESQAVLKIRAVYLAMRDRGSGIFRLVDDSSVSHITYGGFELRVLPGNTDEEFRARIFFTSYLFDKQRAFWRPNPEIIGVELKWEVASDEWQYVDMLTRSGELWQRVYGNHHPLKFPVRAKEDVLNVAVDDSESRMFPLMDHFGVEVHRAQQITGVSPIALSSEQGIESGAGVKKSETPLLIEQDYVPKNEWDRFVKAVAGTGRTDLKVIHQEPVIGMAVESADTGVVFFYDKARAVVLRAEFERGVRERFPMDWVLQRVWESESRFDDYQSIDMARVTYRYPVSDYPFSRNKINSIGMSANISLTKGQ
ncbi:MAG: hypothetical protein MK329_10260 [Pirellulales bacterium]|nr:hypothetical protein [Pirellulales bacterium]